MARAAIAGIAGWIMSSLLYLTGIILNITIPLQFILATGLIVALFVAFLIDRLAIGLAKYLLDLVSLEEELEEHEEAQPTPVETFLVKSLVKKIAKEVLPEVEDVVIFTGDETGEVASLLDPELIDAIAEDLFPDYPDNWYSSLNISIINNKLIIMLDSYTTRVLDRILKNGGEEVAKINSLEELKVIYNLIKKIYLAKYPEASDAMAAYVAYKIILNLIKNNILILPSELLDKLPIEPDHIRRKVLAQIKEELNS